MKPTVHRIPLTVDERAFLNAILAAMIEKGNRTVVPAAAIIANVGLRPDGLVDLTLEDHDRFQVLACLELAALKKRSVFGCRPHLPDAPGFGFMEGHDICPLTLFAKAMLYGDVYCGTPWRDLQGMFCDFEIDIARVRQVLAEEGCHAGFGGKGPYYNKGKPELLKKSVYRALFAVGYMIDSPHYRERDLQFGAYVVCEKAGLGRIRRVPPKKEGGRGRIHFDWHHDMWKPPAARRPPLPEPETLSRADEEAIEGMAA